MMNCNQATRLLSESQERELTLKERMALKMHLMMCSGCKNFGSNLQFMRKAMRDYASGNNRNSSE